MQPVLKIVLFWFFTLTVFSQTETKKLSFTLQEAIDYALQNNLNAKNANRELEQAKLKKWETTTMGLPQINAAIDYQNNLVIQRSVVPAEFFGGNPGEFIDVAFGTKHVMIGRATLSQLIFDRMKKLNVKTVLASHWSDGGKGAVDLAKIVVELCENSNQKMQYAYEDKDTLIEKINKVAKKIYRASEVTMDDKVREQIQNLQNAGYGHMPICIAKTQSSFSTDPKLRGAPSNHSIAVREIRFSAGAEFIVIICGIIMTMPGLSKKPSADNIDYIGGKIVGL